MVTLFSYFNYQEFLRDFFNEKKKECPFFSYRYFGNKLGLDAGFLVKVLQGNMHLAIKSLPSVIGYFHFDNKSAEYFELLVRYGRAKTGREIKLYFEKLLTINGGKQLQVREDQYQFYQKWYYSAIKELLTFYEFTGDYQALAAELNPRISAKEAKTAISLLERIGMIAKDADGRYLPTEKFVTTTEKWKSAAIRSFQQETIRLAGEALDRHPKEDRDISTLTISASFKDLEEIRERVNAFRYSIMNMKNDNKADCVFQINIQVLPLTIVKDGSV